MNHKRNFHNSDLFHVRCIGVRLGPSSTTTVTSAVGVWELCVFTFGLRFTTKPRMHVQKMRKILVQTRLGGEF